jgi:hypothetical protein
MREFFPLAPAMLLRQPSACNPHDLPLTALGRSHGIGLTLRFSGKTIGSLRAGSEPIRYAVACCYMAVPPPELPPPDVPLGGHEGGV